MKLLDVYSIGETLGEGAFGVVATCIHRTTGKDYAVKMVDKVETPLERIQKEVQLMQIFDNENIVKFHGVFYEKCFVCIVMDKYSGGDLVTGLQAHMSEVGPICSRDIVHIALQVGRSICYLHRKSIAHRDIKGDNYLMDRSDMTNPKCHIVLTDFGTTTCIRPGERLSEVVGTKVFWSPEFHDLDYGLKVDVWAMGVVMYGLITGRFPFKDEEAVRKKELKVPKRTHRACADFIKMLVVKIEGARPSSEEVMDHYWISQTDDDPVIEDGEFVTGVPVNHDGANDGVKARRQELFKRLDIRGSQNLGRQTVLPLGMAKSFICEDEGEGKNIRYEWWSVDQVAREGLLRPVKGQRMMVGDEAQGAAYGLESVKKLLEDYNIDTSSFKPPKSSSIERLVMEMRSGAARLMLDPTEHKKLVRAVDVVLLRVFVQPRADSFPLIAMETAASYMDGHRSSLYRLPGNKKKAHENTRQTTHRVLQDMWSLGDASCIECNWQDIDRQEEECESPSYPGVRTVYHYEIVDCRLNLEALDEVTYKCAVERRPWDVIDSQGTSRCFTWCNVAEVEEPAKMNVKTSPATTSLLVRPPVGLDEEALQQELTRLGIDIGQFGRDGAKDLKHFSSEMVRGVAALMQDADGSVKRVVDIVVIILLDPVTREILMQAEQLLNDHCNVPLNRLPACKCRPDENHFICARRFLVERMMADPNQIRFAEQVDFVEEERTSVSYPEMKSVYRKRILRAELVKFA